MDLATLKLFLHVAATGSFSRAAALTASTQSAVSKRISALESELAARLFERTGRGARLTDAGRVLLPRAEALTTEADGLADLVADERRAPRGTVRFAVQPSVAWPLVGNLVAATAARYPGIRLQLAEGTTRQIEEWLAEGRIDIGLMSSAPAAAHAEVTTLFSLPLLLVGRAGGKDAGKRTIPFGQLVRLPLVMATIPNGGRVLLEEEARRQGMALNVVLEVNSIHLIKRLVAQEPYFTIATYPSVAAEIASGALRVRRLVRPRLQQTFYLAIGARRSPGAAVRAIAELIRTLSPPAALPRTHAARTPAATR